MDFSWTCDVVTNTCTASADLTEWAVLALQGVWFVAGAVLGVGMALVVAVVFLRRAGG